MRRTFLALGLLLMSCGGQHSSPTEPVPSLAHGRLSGLVTIGPNCPVEQVNHPCPTPPAAYAARKILIYDAMKKTLLFTLDIDNMGRYFVDLAPGMYMVDLKTASAIDRTDLPKSVEISPGGTATVNVSIDTGIR